MWLESIEKAIERATRKLHFRVVSRMHPELTRLDEDDRLWATWYAADEAPAWQRWLARGVQGVLGPATGVVLAFVLVRTLGLGTRWTWPIVLVAGAAVGYTLSATVIESFRQRSVRRRHFAAMRIFGLDVCPSCGYDMTGHPHAPYQPRTCPECGGTVPPARDDTGQRQPPSRAA